MLFLATQTKFKLLDLKGDIMQCSGEPIRWGTESQDVAPMWKYKYGSWFASFSGWGLHFY